MALSTPAFGNPIVVGGPFRDSWLVAFAAGVLVEACILALLLGRRRFAYVKILCAWLVATTITASLFGGLQALWMGSPFLLFVPGEILIVLAEACAILAICRLRFFQRKDAIQLGMRAATGYSLAINAASLLVSVLIPMGYSVAMRAF